MDIVFEIRIEFSPFFDYETFCSVYCISNWHHHSLQMEEFRTKMQRAMPKVPKKESSGRSDFKTVRELVNYLIDEDARKKADGAKKT